MNVLILSRSALTLGLGTLVLASAAQAQTTPVTGYQYSYDPAKPLDSDEGRSDAAGRINRVEANYDLASQTFSYYANVGTTNLRPDGFWLAVNGGPNPKGHAGEMALFYFDGSTPGAPKLTAYAYNGVNGDNSYKDGNGRLAGNQAPDRIQSSLLDQSFAKDITYRTEKDGSRTLGFTIDATVVNNHVPKYPGPGGADEWTGAQFGKEIGIWFHPIAGMSTAYQNGYLTSLSYQKGGWLDVAGEGTKAVPEPATLLSMGAGLGLLARRRRAKKA